MSFKLKKNEIVRKYTTYDRLFSTSRSFHLNNIWNDTTTSAVLQVSS